MDSLPIRSVAAPWFAVLLVTSGFSGDAAAASMEQAKAQCHDQFVPVVQSCVRKKWADSGGKPSQYIDGCREAIMPQARACIVKLMGGDNAGETENGAAEIDFPPPAGKGRAVLVLSGIDGTSPYRDYAEKIAKLGYYAVLINGKEILAEDGQGGERLRTAIAKAQGSPSVLPGKIAVIGFSLGGGGALDYAERQPDKVAVVIAYYPFTGFIARTTDMKAFVGNFQVPLVAFAGGKDAYNNCCLLETIRSMETIAKGLNKPMDLVVYPDAEHNFIKGATYRADDTDNAWRRTADTLHRYLN
jgi:dienelactone hydrolase